MIGWKHGVAQVLVVLPQVLRAPPEPKLASLLAAGPGVSGKGEEGVGRGGNDAALHSALALASDLLAKLNVVPLSLFPCILRAPVLTGAGVGIA
jgi:hypothetical protein